MADMTIEQIVWNLGYISGKYNLTEKEHKIIDEATEKMAELEAYENADLIERNKVLGSIDWNIMNLVGIGDEALELLHGMKEKVSNIPRFNPKGDSEQI